MTYKIYGDEEDIMLGIYVDGWCVFGMTLNPVKPESREWLAKHLDESFQRASQRAAHAAVEQHKAEIRKLLGIGESE